MKGMRFGLLALVPLLVLASALQAAVLKEAVLTVKGMVCPS